MASQSRAVRRWQLHFRTDRPGLSGAGATIGPAVTFGYIAGKTCGECVSLALPTLSCGRKGLLLAFGAVLPYQGQRCPEESANCGASRRFAVSARNCPDAPAKLRDLSPDRRRGGQYVDGPGQGDVRSGRCKGSGAPSLIRVVPGNPDESYIIMKLEGTHIENRRNRRADAVWRAAARARKNRKIATMDIQGANHE